MDHFENIQSTNWQTIRFKPPPVNSPIGWRVEFRSMEIQMTDFENAAFSVFIVLLTRAIISFDLNFYMPISKVRHHLQTGRGLTSRWTRTCKERKPRTPPNSAHSTSDVKSSPTTVLRRDTILDPVQYHHRAQHQHHVALPHLPHLLIGYTTSTVMQAVTVLPQGLGPPNQHDVQVPKKRRNRDLR
jgi:hypothetical protein